MLDDGDEADARGYELAFTQGLRWLSDQGARLETLRSRIATLFSAALVVGGLLITQVFSSNRGHPVTAPGVVALLVALGALAVMIIAVLRVWWPTGDFNVNLDPRLILRGIADDPGAPLADLHRDFAHDIGNGADANQVVLTRLQRWFSRAAVAFVVGVLALGVALWDVLT